jgi:triose-phosphate isomerase
MKKPFFVVNPKSYLYGEKLYSLALKADEVADKYNVEIYFTAPFVELQNINKMTKNIFLTAQHMDDTKIGRGMGHIVGEMLVDSGVKAVVLNHAEHKVENEKLESTIQRAKELGLKTIVCASTYDDVKYVAGLHPFSILCEPTELIGTGITSGNDYIDESSTIIRTIDPEIYVMQAAGVTTPEDVYNIIFRGADATGCTSGIVSADNPEEMIEKMVTSLIKGYQERK